MKLSRDSTAPLVDATHYMSIVGSLRYLVHNLLDISFAVGFVSRFMERPTEEHMATVKRLLRYISGTIGYGLVYKKSDFPDLVGYSDSDHAGDIDTRKSTTGMMFYLGDNLISWQSVKQRVVALSSCEAEYVAATMAATQGIWLARLLGELKGEAPSTVKLRLDNMSALALSRNPVHHERNKHMEVRYHSIRDCVIAGQIYAEFISTKDQLADLQTKAFGRVKFQELQARIGMVNLL